MAFVWRLCRLWGRTEREVHGKSGNSNARLSPGDAAVLCMDTSGHDPMFLTKEDF